MSWTVYGVPFETSEFSDTSKYQSIVTNKNIILRGVRTWFIFDGDPTFTDVAMKLYGSQETTVTALLDETEQPVPSVFDNYDSIGDGINSYASANIVSFSSETTIGKVKVLACRSDSNPILDLNLSIWDATGTTILYSEDVTQLFSGLEAWTGENHEYITIELDTPFTMSASTEYRVGFYEGSSGNGNMNIFWVFPLDSDFVGVRWDSFGGGTPPYTYVMSLYSTGSEEYTAELPTSLIASSENTLTKSEIITLDNGVKEVYFDFNYVPMQKNTTYHFVVNGTGAAFTSSSHLAWRVAWPDPVYSEGWTPTIEKLGVAPYALYIVGGEY